MIPSWARRGAKVVCTYPHSFWIDLDTHIPCTGPVKDEVCTVDGVITDEQGRVALRIMEHVLPPAEDGYLIEFFRPLVAPKTEAEDVALFYHIAGMSPSERLDRLEEMLSQ